MLFSDFFWNRIEAAGVPRVALQQSSCGEIGTPCSPEPLDGGFCITGTGRVKATMLTHPGANQETVDFDEEEQDDLHCLTWFFQCLCNEFLSAS